MTAAARARPSPRARRTSRPDRTWHFPLENRGILITRPERQSRALQDALHELGAATVCVPTIEIAGPRSGGTLDAALRRLGDYDWVVVTSPNGSVPAARHASRAGS